MKRRLSDYFSRGGVSLELRPRFSRAIRLGALGLLAFSVCALSQQAAEPLPLTLQHAVTIALEKNPARKIALADTRVASADVREARSILMPHLNFSETATRGDDPVYVFGSKLRQQRFSNADFALNQLNTPLPFGNFSTRFAGSWNLFDSFASWHGVNRARQMNEAAAHQLERADQEIVFRVVDAYYGVLLARKQLEVAEQAAQNRAVHHGPEPGEIRQRVGRRVGFADGAKCAWHHGSRN